MKHLTGLAFLVLIILSCRSTAMAGQANFDIDVRELPHPAGEPAPPKRGFEIDLKDLRRAPAGTNKPPHRGRRRAVPASVTPETVRREGTSSYIVKAGDFPFLILMRTYGLSSTAAERLIPEVLRLNNIRNPRELTVGQRLTIPLPAPAGRARTIIVRTAPQTSQTPPPAQHNTLPVPAERQASIPAAPPCLLARAVAEQLGLLATPVKPQLNGVAFTAANAGLKVVVACGLTSAELYTYTRLLAYEHAQLLAFKGDESPARVIESLAGRLKLSFRLADPANADTLPVSYIFPAQGPAGRDVRLTIRPVEESKPLTSPVSPPKAPASSIRQ